MKPKYLYPLVVLLASLFIGWLSGFDFNYRSPGVAVWGAATAFFMLIGFTIAKQNEFY